MAEKCLGVRDYSQARVRFLAKDLKASVNCERGVVDQRVRLLIRGSALVNSLSEPTHMEDEQDSIESIAMPQEADLDDEQIRALLASPRYLPEREASAERSQVHHSERDSLMSSSSQGLKFIGTGELVALFSHRE